MKPELEELQKKDQILEKEKERIRLCMKLNICPICGEKIITKTENHPNSFGWWIFKHNWTFNIDYNVCSKDEKHYKDSIDYDDDY